MSDHKPIEKSKDPRSTMLLTHCDMCDGIFFEKPSSLKRKKRKFCSMACYSQFRKDKLPLTEQHAYKGVRREGENKQVYHRRFCERHPDLIAHLKARRYAREKGAEGSHTLKEWEDMLSLFNHRCAICKENKPLTKDHIIPLSRRGSDYIKNIQPLCKSCNSKKNAKTMDELSLVVCPKHGT